MSLRIGAHISIAKGLPKAAAVAHAIGANTFAFFTRNPRGSAKRTISSHEIRAWQKVRRTADLFPIVGHLPYTINLGSGNDDTWHFGRSIVREDLVRAHEFGAEYLVVHPGRIDARLGLVGSLARVVRALDWILDDLDSATVLLLEGMAGQGSELGDNPEQLGAILKSLGFPDGLGVCLDSCHQFAAGWDVITREGLDEMLAAYDEYVGLERIKVLHLNDSKMERGSKKDRHEKVGEGLIGVNGMRTIVNHPFFRTLPLILETPADDYSDYAKQIALLRKLSEQ